MLREYLNLMGQSEAKERLEHISTQLQHTRTKEQVKHLFLLKKKQQNIVANNSIHWYV